MVPPIIQANLSRLRSRERWLRLTWLAARAVAVVLSVLATACLLDFFLDYYQDTPFTLRQALLLGQVLLWAVAVVVIVASLIQRVSDTWLSLWVEERVASLGHRLISAVQLNLPGAKTEGMSPTMIAALTREAEVLAERMRFEDLADRRRLQWSLGLLTPFALVFLALFVLWPQVVVALIARQFLAEREIPRSVTLEDVSRPVWPRGEEVTLAFRATGLGVTEELTGEVRITPDEGRLGERYPLTYQGREDTGVARFTARVPLAVADFAYVARLGDGRQRQPGRIRLEARPQVVTLDAWVRLPAACGLQLHPLDLLQQKLPISLFAAQPFAEYQRGGDLVQRMPGSSARVVVVTQKPLANATLELLGAPDGGAEVVRRRVPMALDEEGTAAEVVFQPRPDEVAYRLEVVDRNGFENRDRPQRTLRSEPADPPQVSLLPEYFSRIDRGFSEEHEVEGIPLLAGERIRIAYRCTTPYGLSRAQLRYRVLTEEEAQLLGEDGVRRFNRPWQTLLLPEISGTLASGPFDPRRGVFHHSGREAQVYYHAVPAADFDTLGGVTGGGRFDFQTRPLTVGTIRFEFLAALTGSPTVPLLAGAPWAALALSLEPAATPTRPLAVGDRVEFFVEVFDRNPDPDRPPGRSERRWKVVVTEQRLMEWIIQKDDQKQRIRDLEAKQRGLYGDSADEKQK